MPNDDRFTAAAWSVLDRAGVPLPASGGLRYTLATTDSGVAVLIVAPEDRPTAFDTISGAVIAAVARHAEGA